jgi:hypothetical protein
LTMLFNMTDGRRATWELAGLTEATIGGPTDFWEWFLPSEVVLHNLALYWTIRLPPDIPVDPAYPAATYPFRTSGDKELLDGFLEFSDPAVAFSERLTNFARRYGVLNICKHSVPASHASEPILLPPDSPQHGYCWAEEVAPVWTTEPLEGIPTHWYQRGWFSETPFLWCRYAKTAQAILDVAAALELGQPPRRSAIDVLAPGSTTNDLAPYQWRWLISDTVNQWLGWGNVRPAFSLTDHGPIVKWSAGSMFGAMAAQLMTAITRHRGLAICSGCGCGYTPSRLPRPSGRHYCRGCRERAIPGRDAARSHRLRKRSMQAAARSDL